MFLFFFTIGCGVKTTIESSSSVIAENESTNALDTYLQTLEDKNKLQGSFIVTRESKPLFQKAYGFLDSAGAYRANTESTYRIGSISKTYTATMILQLLDEGKLTLDQSIDLWFPSIPNAKKITVLQLLKHRSGLFNITNDPQYLSWHTNPIDQQELVEKIASYSTVFEPNSKAEYSNSNYILLGFIIEKLDNRSLAQSLKMRISDTIGANHTEYGDKIEIENNEAGSFIYQNTWVSSPQTDMSVPRGAGAYVSNPSDLCLFAESLFDGTLLSQKALATMTDFQDSFGAGMFEIAIENQTYYGHTGGIDAFRSIFLFHAEDKTCIAYSLNAFNYKPKELLLSLVQASKNEVVVVPSFKKIELTQEQLQAYVGVYTSSQFPLNITIQYRDGMLYGQATGQSEFPLEPRTNGIFAFDASGLELEFPQTNEPLQQEFRMHQGGQSFKFTRENKEESETIELSEEELISHVGVYSSDQMPLEITIEHKDGVLFAQATGQAAFPLDPKAAGVFAFESAMLKLHFVQSNEEKKQEFTLEQAGQRFLFRRKN